MLSHKTAHLYACPLHISKHFHSHSVMSMFSLKVMRELQAGLLLVMCARRDTVVTPIYTPPLVSGNKMSTGE
jgi:predicted PP-loop superfamily ATPase